ASPHESVVPVTVAHPVEGDSGLRARGMDEPPVAEIDTRVPHGTRGAGVSTVGVPKQDVERTELRIGDAPLQAGGHLRGGSLRQRPARVSASRCIAHPRAQDPPYEPGAIHAGARSLAAVGVRRPRVAERELDDLAPRGAEG